VAKTPSEFIQAAGAAATMPLALNAAAQAGPASGFVSPPNEARPWVHWFWKNGNVTRDGDDGGSIGGDYRPPGSE
jgi:hypothetical protein